MLVCTVMDGRTFPFGVALRPRLMKKRAVCGAEMPNRVLFFYFGASVSWTNFMI